MPLLIANYDSFTWNLVQRLGEIAPELPVEVYRNDQITGDEVAAKQPRYLVISPGPCTPDEAGVSCELVRRFAGRMPILGVCLGHQAIGQVFGGQWEYNVVFTEHVQAQKLDQRLALLQCGVEDDCARLCIRQPGGQTQKVECHRGKLHCLGVIVFEAYNFDKRS